MKIELFGRQTMVFGKKGMGKSNFVQHLLADDRYRNTLVFDTNREHANTNLPRYCPKHRRGDEARAELGELLSRYVVTDREYRDIRPDLVVLEELSRYAPNRGSMADELGEFIDLARHYDVGLLGVARRPAQVDTDTVELADNTVIFRVDGDNDVKKLNRLSSGLGDAAADLPKYHFLVYDGSDYAVHEPVPEHDTTGKL